VAIIERAIGAGKDVAPPGTAEVLGPTAVDRQIRDAILFCWMLLPQERRTVSTVAAEIRRIVERALANLMEDDQVFSRSSQESEKGH
jgi:hypothetical protein